MTSEKSMQGAESNRRTNPWAYGCRSHKTILGCYENSAELEWTRLSPLFEFYVLHSPVVGQSDKGVSIMDCGWSVNSWKGDLGEKLDSALSDIRGNFYLPSRYRGAGLSKLFYHADLVDGVLSDVVTERAASRQASDPYAYLRLFRHIRNCLAHGRFIVVDSRTDSGLMIIMEDRDRYSITARMVLRLETLEKWREIVLGGPES